MFGNLQEKLESAFKNLKGQARITDLNIAATVKEIRRALVDADVNYKIAKEFTDRIKDKAMGEKVLTAVSPGQLMVKIVQDELTELHDDLPMIVKYAASYHRAGAALVKRLTPSLARTVNRRPGPAAMP